MFDEVKTHYLIYKEASGENKKKFITEKMYNKILLCVSKKIEFIIIDDETQHQIKRIAIIEIKRITENERKDLNNKNNYLIICDDCKGKYSQEGFNAHIKECMEYKYQNWKAVYPEQAKAWEDRLKTINTKKDQYKTVQQLVSEVF